jgi:phospholipid transport system substrate-binding protein
MTMMWILRTVVAASMLMSSFVVAAIEDPQQLVRNTGDKVLAELDARKPELEADPTLVYPLVKETLLPHFDFGQMAQSAMGRFWRRATDEQKAGVIDEFQKLLVRTYATALLAYSGQQIEYLPGNFRPDDTKVLVQTRIAAADNAPAIPINYRLRLDDDQKWKVYDVVIDGVSLITNYRSQFAAVIGREGIDGLIAGLAEKNDVLPAQ